MIQAIREKAKEQGLNSGQTAARFQLSPSHWQALCGGSRLVQGLRQDRLKLMARFLGRPYIEVLSLAELVEPGDFVVHQTIEDRLNAIYLIMKTDSLWNPLLPNEEVWDSADRQVKLLLARMYLQLSLEALADHSAATAG